MSGSASERFRELAVCPYDKSLLSDWGKISPITKIATKGGEGCQHVFELNTVTGKIYFHENNSGKIYCLDCGSEVLTARHRYSVLRSSNSMKTVRPNFSIGFPYCPKCEPEPKMNGKAKPFLFR